MERYDVIVVGAGHAGIEAALAAARMGRKTACVTMRLDRIGHLPCNCSIGGPAKGHIAREVDALGGQMGVTTDRAMTHLRRVGTGKGPAVRTVRAQVCKRTYPHLMTETLSIEPNLNLLQAEVQTVLRASGRVSGVRTSVGDLSALCVVLTTGTFLNGLMHEGVRQSPGGRHGEAAVGGLSEFLVESGHELKRFKTGTTPRVRLSSLDLSECQVMPSEPEAGPLSFLHDAPMPERDLLPTWQTHTNERVHEVLRRNLDKSAMYAGRIEGVGPRYCPSVEDKVVKFADRDSHPVFLEIEEWGGESVYVQGFSTSMPAEVQIEALRAIPGLAEVEMLRPGYAVEYDMADPSGLLPSLMSKGLEGLYLAGQINGTSGYEEAAGQGIAAGINAARWARGEPPVIFERATSFIGVMIDDLVTKGVEDPYRMLTARAEYRLVLRHDNADRRLTPLAIELGIASEARRERFESKLDKLDALRHRLSSAYLYEDANERLESLEIAPIKGRASALDLLKRPEVSLELVSSLTGVALPTGEIGRQASEQIELEATYDGYLAKQEEEIEQARALESLAIPPAFEFSRLRGLSYESIEKLSRVRPATIGQASRIPGVRPADIALLIGHLRKKSDQLVKSN